MGFYLFIDFFSVQVNYVLYNYRIAKYLAAQYFFPRFQCLSMLSNKPINHCTHLDLYELRSCKKGFNSLLNDKILELPKTGSTCRR